MILNGKSTVLLNGTETRILSHEWNVALRATRNDLTASFVVADAAGNALEPSSGDWSDVSAKVRAGKSATVRLAAPKKRSSKRRCDEQRDRN